MTHALRLGLRLAVARGREQRLRATSVFVAVCVGTVVLLATAAIVHSERVQQPSVYESVDNQRLLAAVVAAVLLPVLVLAATVGRLSASLRDRRMANLRLLGMAPLQVRAAAAVESGVAALAGAVAGVPTFLVTRWPLSRIEVAGHGWPSSTLWPYGWVWAVVVVLLPAVVMAVAALPARLAMADALTKARRADAQRPRGWRVVPLLAGVGACLYVVQVDPTHGLPGTVIVALFAGIGLLAIGLILVVPVFVRLLADLAVRVSARPSVTVAARRLQSQPAGVTRVVSGLLLGLFVAIGARCVVVAFESTPQYRQAAAQVDRGAMITFTLRPGERTSATAEATQVTGVRAAVALPRLASRCDTDATMCVNAVVATCAQLTQALGHVTGCRDGVVVVDAALGRGQRVTLPPLFSVDSGGNVRSALPPLQLTGERAALDGGNALAFDGRQLGPLYADVVVPPSTPGVEALAGRTQQVMVVRGVPGRAMADRLQQLPFAVESGADFVNYDFVAKLRAIVWTVAGVILGIGLLTFAVAAVDRAVTRRREVTALQLVGVPRSLLRRTQWMEAAAPLALGCCLAIGLGLLAGATYLSLDSESLPAPWKQCVALAAVAAVGATIVGAFTVIASSPRISPDLIRRE